MSASLCYSLSGRQSPYNDIGYIPCNQTAVDNGQHTACCAPGDACLANGLCQNAIDHNLASNRYWRVGCTDKTFQDAACPKYCEDIDTKVYNHVVYKCSPSTTWCCGTGGDPALWPTFSGRNSTCCNIDDLTFDGGTTNAYVIAGGAAIVESFTSESATATPTSATSTSPVSASPTHSGSQSPSGVSSTVKIGVGVGIPVAVLFIGALSLLIYIMRKRHRELEVEKVYPEHAVSSDPEAYVSRSAELADRSRFEMASRGIQHAQLDAREIPMELQGAAYWPADTYYPPDRK